MPATLSTVSVGRVPAVNTGGAGTNHYYVIPTAASISGYISKLHWCGAAAEDVTIIVASGGPGAGSFGAGGAFTPVRSKAVAMAAGLNAISNIDLKIDAGQYVVVRSASGALRTSGLGTGQLSWYTANADLSNIQWTYGIRIEAGFEITGTVAAQSDILSRAMGDTLSTQRLGLAAADVAAATAWSSTIWIVPEVPVLFDGYVIAADAWGTNAGTLSVYALDKMPDGKFRRTAVSASAATAGKTSLGNLRLPIKAGQYVGYRHTGVPHYVNGVGPKVYYLSAEPAGDAVGTSPTNSLASARMQFGCTIEGTVRGGVTTLQQRVGVLEGGVSPWSGKKWGALGTSITAGDPWMGAVAANLGMSVTDAGIGGGKITLWSGSGGEVPAQISSLPTDCALVTLEGSVNDWWNSAPLGVYTDTAQGTFYGALWATYGAIRARCANALIVLMVDWNTSGSLGAGAGNTQESQDVNGLGLSPWHYQEAMIRSAMMAGLNVIRMWDAGMGYFTPAGFYTDHIHQSATGNARLAALVERQLRNWGPYV